MVHIAPTAQMQDKSTSSPVTMRNSSLFSAEVPLMPPVLLLNYKRKSIFAPTPLSLTVAYSKSI